MNKFGITSLPTIRVASWHPAFPFFQAQPRTAVSYNSGFMGFHIQNSSLDHKSYNRTIFNGLLEIMLAFFLKCRVLNGDIVTCFKKGCF